MPKIARNLTVLIPAFNEAENIGQTVESIKSQTVQPKEIFVVDDGSTDNTGQIAKKLGARVLRSPGTRSKAGAQNYGLPAVNTELVMTVDADTTLAPDAIEKILPALSDPKVGAACGSVYPKNVRVLWERGRYIEYLLAFSYYKPIQDYYDTPLVASGCFSVYRTSLLKKFGGWSRQTVAEDMDLTWKFYSKGLKVKFVDPAVCYPIEPYNFKLLVKQLRRWSHGYIQNAKLHFRQVMRIPYLRLMILSGLWESLFAPIFYFIFIPTLILTTKNSLYLFLYVIDFPIVVVPVIFKALERKEIIRSITSLPAFFVIRFINCAILFEAFVSELLLNKKMLAFEKGH